MLRKALLAVALAASMSIAASAQSIQQTLGDFGLLGRWATDCSREAASDNFYTVFRSSSGRVLRTYYDGPGKVYNEYVITQATHLANGRLRYVQEGTDSRRLRLEVVVTMDGGRLLVWSSRYVDGEFLVKDGKYTDDGTRVGGQDRCGN
jgi:hypothetical protein